MKIAPRAARPRTLAYFVANSKPCFRVSTQYEIDCDSDRKRLTLWLSALRSWLSALSPRTRRRPQVSSLPLLRYGPHPASSIQDPASTQLLLATNCANVHIPKMTVRDAAANRDVTPISRAVCHCWLVQQCSTGRHGSNKPVARIGRSCEVGSPGAANSQADEVTRPSAARCAVKRLGATAGLSSSAPLCAVGDAARSPSVTSMGPSFFYETPAGHFEAGSCSWPLRGRLEQLE
jgi:hypothetical protein